MPHGLFELLRRQFWPFFKDSVTFGGEYKKY